MEFPTIRGTILGGQGNEDYSMFGSILGYLYIGKSPYKL